MKNNIIEWLITNHIGARLVALVVIISGLFIGGESDSARVKWCCCALVVPLLTMAQLDVDAWRYIFRIKPPTGLEQSTRAPEPNCQRLK